jgi:hypothetical protein
MEQLLVVQEVAQGRLTVGKQGFLMISYGRTHCSDGDSMPPELGYCTNVHAGPDLESTKANLQDHALRVKESFSPGSPMGIGLWLAAPAAASLQDGPALEEFRDWLGEHGLHPFTLNGFPFGNFHQEVVKHDVYHPTWMEDKRLTYTLHLVHALDQLLPPGSEGSISTLPIAWGSPASSPEMLGQAADNLLTVARHLSELEDRSGRLIYLCLEPEPGCILQRSDDVLRFFQDHLLVRGEEHQVLRYLRVCHDVCHSAVMFERQADVLAQFSGMGIRVGKVQVSSAVEARFQELSPEHRATALDQLAGFAEHRYLHQTSTRQSDGTTTFYQDLSEALDQVDDATRLEETWCIHFHVPVYLRQFGELHTSQEQIRECLEAVRQDPEMTHFEVETYAWGVLPESLQVDQLSEGIAREMKWFAELLEQTSNGDVRD